MITEVYISKNIFMFNSMLLFCYYCESWIFFGIIASAYFSLSTSRFHIKSYVLLQLFVQFLS